VIRDDYKYLVIKRADVMKYLSEEDRAHFSKCLSDIALGRASDKKSVTTKFVVVADDWPMYDTTWKLIEEWVDNDCI